MPTTSLLTAKNSGTFAKGCNETGNKPDPISFDHQKLLKIPTFFFSSPKKYTKMVSLSVSSCFLSYISLLSIIAFPFTASITTTIPLSNTYIDQNPFRDSYQKLNHIASTSIRRAHHLKNPQPTTTAPVFSHSYGAYSVPLSFGTPPQTLPFIMDTGSHFVWFPCTSGYTCKNCSFSSMSAPKINPFIPKQSSTSKVIGCKNPKCTWLHPTNLQCQNCNNSKNCAQICPPYLIMYGSGATGGIAMSETLRLRNLKVPNFFVGCSVFSSHTPSGIAGFGRGPASLPSQLGLSKFSYCLLSRKFDDMSASSSLVLDSEFDSGSKTTSFSYTPFVQNPKVEDRPAFSVYYYVNLRRITVGGQRVKIPFKYLTPGSDGNGGTIVDSGTTFTYMARDAFEPLSGAFTTEMKKSHARAVAVEALTGLSPCFNISGKKTVSFPEMTLHFKGGADMALPLENYFAVVGERDAVCLTVVTDREEGAVAVGGPGIVLGSFQMQNYYVEYDLRNGRFGFKKQLCE